MVQRKGFGIMPVTILELGKNKYRLMVSGKYDAKGKRVRHSKTIEVKSKRAAEKELALYVAQCEQGDMEAPPMILEREVPGDVTILQGQQDQRVMLPNTLLKGIWITAL